MQSTGLPGGKAPTLHVTVLTPDTLFHKLTQELEVVNVCVQKPDLVRKAHCGRHAWKCDLAGFQKLRCIVGGNERLEISRRARPSPTVAGVLGVVWPHIHRTMLCTLPTALRRLCTKSRQHTPYNVNTKCYIPTPMHQTQGSVGLRFKSSLKRLVSKSSNIVHLR